MLHRGENRQKIIRPRLSLPFFPLPLDLVSTHMSDRRVMRSAACACSNSTSCCNLAYRTIIDSYAGVV